MNYIITLIFCFFCINSYSQNKGCFLSGTGNTGGTTKFSGDVFLDQIMTEEYNFLAEKFYVYPDMYYLQDGNGPNAMATPEISNYNYPDGTVLVGLNLIAMECTNSGSGTCSAVPIIMAHEFAHIVDFKYKISENNSLRKGTVKNSELLADFLAGCFMYIRIKEFKYLNIKEAANAFFSKGDYEFNNPSHHGTPKERLDYLMSGYKLASEKYDNGGLSLKAAIQGALNKINGNDNESSLENENIEALIQECLGEKVRRCIRSCQSDYNLSLQQCKDFYCAISNNPQWRKECEEEIYAE